MTLPLLCLSCGHGSTTRTSYKVGVVSCTHPSKTTEKDKVVTNCLACDHYIDAHQEPLTFTSDQIAKILSGRKTGTTRRTIHGANGDVFLVAGLPYRIVNIEATFLRYVIEMPTFWRAEGCSSQESAKELFARIYPDLNPTAIVYFHTFAAVRT